MEFEKAVSEAHLKASGWNMGAFGHSSPFECHFVYVNDLDSKEVRLFSVAKTDLDAVQMPDGVPSHVLAFMVADSLAEISTGVINPERDSSFLPKLIGYVKCTKTFGHWLATGKDRLHFVINVYRSRQGPQKTMLRPFAADSNHVVLPAAEMMALSKKVLLMDKKKHPEWFR
ncbi:MAG: hypothetical protein CML22_07225 [Rheinheimera sp.]|nr:hypothetical protein [Rheinheimera sp.]MBM34075.1 hypothetical protein [Rheinheimera sp.]|tara:strand:- start:531 stop:1046 length:516 start_codon:yes stop_codon:yes gene_type:complete